MDKKYSYIMLIVGGCVLVLYFLLNSTTIFRKAKVYYEPSSENIMVADANFENYVLNTNGLGQKIINASDGDVSLSPYMLGNSIGIYIEGTQTTNNEQARLTLGMNDNIKQEFSSLNNVINKAYGENGLAISAIYADKNIELSKDFISSLAYYNAKFETLDFKNFVSAKSNINSYANKVSNGKIQSFIDEVYPNTSLVLLSAVQHNFKFKNVLQNPKIENNILSASNASINVFEDDKAIYLEIPLENEFTYEVYMPKENIGEMNLAKIKEYKSLAIETNVSLQIPQLDTQVYNNLKTALINAGFEKPFELTKANKGEITQVSKIDQRLDIQLELGEDILINKTAKSDIKIDKSYYYSITHKGTNTKVVLGRKIL